MFLTLFQHLVRTLASLLIAVIVSYIIIMRSNEYADYGIFKGFYNYISYIVNGEFLSSSKMKIILENLLITLDIVTLALIAGLLLALIIGFYVAMYNNIVTNIIDKMFNIMRFVPYVLVITIIYPYAHNFYVDLLLSQQSLVNDSLLVNDIGLNSISFLIYIIFISLLVGYLVTIEIYLIVVRTAKKSLELSYIRVISRSFSRFKVIWEFLLSRVMINVLYILPRMLATLLGFTIVFEIIFKSQGIGNILLESVLSSNYTSVSNVILLLNASIIIFNFMVWTLRIFIDPYNLKEVASHEK